LNKAGVAVPVGLIVGAPVLVGITAWLLHRQRPAAPSPAPVPAPEVAVATR
jgi:hypothetical protein